LGGALPSALGHDDIAESPTPLEPMRAEGVTLLPRLCRQGARYAAGCLGFGSRGGLSLTTVQVTPAASAITPMMKKTRPMSPRTVDTADLE